MSALRCFVKALSIAVIFDADILGGPDFWGVDRSLGFYLYNYNNAARTS